MLTDSEPLQWQEKVYELKASSGAIAGELSASLDEWQKNVEEFLNHDISLTDIFPDRTYQQATRIEASNASTHC